MNTLVLAVGLPASGKTYHLSKLFSLERDNFISGTFIEEGDTHLKQDYLTVVDRLLITADDVTNLLKEFYSQNNELVIDELRILYFDKDVEACLYNDLFRQIDRSSRQTILDRQNDLVSIKELKRAIQQLRTKTIVINYVNIVKYEICRADLIDNRTTIEKFRSYKHDEIRWYDNQNSVELVTNIVKEFLDESELEVPKVVELEAILEILSNVETSIEEEYDYYGTTTEIVFSVKMDSLKTTLNDIIEFRQ